MKSKETLCEEFVFVGHSHGDMADTLAPLFEEDPMKVKNISDVLYDGEVFLQPRTNDYDDHTIEVFVPGQKRLAWLWAPQAAALKLWMKEHGCYYVRAHVHRVDKTAGVLMATPDTPLHLDLSRVCNSDIDMHWADDLVEVKRSIEEQSKELAVTLLRDELQVAEEWSPRLQICMNNAMTHLQVDLSVNCFMASVEVYHLMASSEISELRMLSSSILYLYVKRGSTDRIAWWVNHWLPNYFSMLAGDDLLAMYEEADYTLADVEVLLKRAPYGLFYLYKVNKMRFAKRLLYSYLPQEIYNRLLTLLAVWEMMRKSLTPDTSKRSLTPDPSPKGEGSDMTKGGLSKREKMREKIADTIEKMYAEGELKHKYDFTWLMMIMNQEDDLPTFETPSAYVEYLKDCGLRIDLPTRSTISRYYDKARGSYPNWTFNDATETETTRRNNIAKRFIILLKRE